MTKSKPKTGKITGNQVWRDFFKNDYLSSHDLTTDLVVTIKEMQFKTVTGPGGRKEDKLICVFTDPETLPMIMNTTNSKAIADLYGTKKPAEWVGKSVILYADPTIKMKGEIVGGIRIRPVKPDTTKPKLPQERFEKMVQQILAGKYTTERAKSDWALSAEQLETLKSFE